MKRLIREEGKQVGTLYHFTSISNLLMLLDANTLYSKRKNICFTRNQNFISDNREVSGTDCRLEIDGDSLSNSYKIEPYNDEKFTENNPVKLEQEERINEEIISPIIPYIKEITIYDMSIIDNQDAKIKRINEIKQRIENTYNIPVKLEI